VVGAGIQGCTIAIELAMRGVPVTLFDSEARPMERASRWNEGKIHLGYVYANDASLETARTMLRGALVFRRRMSEYLEQSVDFGELSSSFIYGVHRDSVISPEAVTGHLASVDRLISEAFDSADVDYLGEKRLPETRPIPADRSPFDPTLIATAIETPERAINPHQLGDAVARRVLSDPTIEFAPACRIERIGKAVDGRYWLTDGSGRNHGPYREAVNAAWESRLMLDSTIGILPAATWMHRYKLALHVSVATTYEIPSVTVTLGPFGDVVKFGGGRVYLSWYPATLIATSTNLAPSEPEETFDNGARAKVAHDVIHELSRLLPALRDRDWDGTQFQVRGGHIFAWGESDISDPSSRLHERHAVGVNSFLGYHSVDTGKYGLAPMHAMVVAARISGEV
jgi:glycine/D-amino acid oxidase-like deaminating enzyme